MELLNSILSAKTFNDSELDAFLAKANEEIHKAGKDNDLVTLVRSKGIDTQCSIATLVKEIVMAFIYDDISYQASTYVRHDNVSRMDSFCRNEKLNPEKIRLIMRYLRDIETIIQAH